MLTAGRFHKLDVLELCWPFEVSGIPSFGESTDWTRQTKLPMVDPTRISFAFLSRKLVSAAPTVGRSGLEVLHMVLLVPSHHPLELLDVLEFWNHTALQVDSHSLS